MRPSALPKIVIINFLFFNTVWIKTDKYETSNIGIIILLKRYKFSDESGMTHRPHINNLKKQFIPSISVKMTFFRWFSLHQSV